MLRKKVLFTLPFSGGSSLSYRNWMNLIRGDILLCNLDYAGHGKRLGEPFNNNIEQIIEDITEKIIEQIDTAYDFSIYGHSLGGLIAYYVSIKLQDRYHMPPLNTFIGASRPPHLFNNGERYDKSSVIKRLIEEKRFSEDIASSYEFQNFIYPMIENDLKVIEVFDFRKFQNSKLCNKIVCFYGSEDKQVTYFDIRGWENYSRQPVQYIQISGKHLFVECNEDEICEIINDKLGDIRIN